MDDMKRDMKSVIEYTTRCASGHLTQKKATSQGGFSQVVNVVAAFLFFLPEGQVLFEELNNTLGVAEVILFELVDFVEGLLECLISEITSSLVVLHDLVVENREVKG